MPEQIPDKKRAKDQPLPEARRRNWSAPVVQDARDLAGLAFARAGFRDPTLVLRWAEIAGPEVARLTCPIRLSEGASGGVLTLKAEPGAALFLQHESRSLCGRINDYLGRVAVTKLKFVQGQVQQRPNLSPHLSTGGTIPVDDPVHDYSGPEKVRESLLRFARTRRRSD